MHERIEYGANLLKNHVFQFDFLNDDFTKLPQSLQDIINDEEKRKKLVIYINPPYAESGDAKQKHGTGENKAGTAKGNNINIKYSKELGRGKNELFVQFLIRIFKELPSVKIANFSKLKNLQSPAFKEFRNNFNAKLENLFIAPADTFDNVKGQFPIGFFIWNSDRTEIFNEILADVYNKNSEFIKQKLICSYDKEKNIGVWFNRIRNKENHLSIGMMESGRNDFQHNNLINIQHNISTEKSHAATINFTLKNLIPCCVFFSVRLSIEATWLNDRDQFLYPNDNWENDTEFQNDCLAYTLFHGQNRITSKEGTNHWIPFTEQEVNAQNKFESHFMTDFINGKIKVEEEVSLFGSASSPNQKREFSEDAKAVFDAGRELWKYYHSNPNVNVNASLYDIREYFQDRNDKGRMNSKSDDAKYMELIGELRNKLNFLADKIKPKIYEYEFLKE
jgi:hypothetical protein